MLRPWHYSLVLDKDSPLSIHQQLTEHFRSMIEGGSWLGGSALPSSRDIAQRLGINRKTVSRVYEELSAQGLIYTQPKRGTFVAESAPAGALGQEAAHATMVLHPDIDTTANSIHQLIQQACVHHIRRAALHMHKLRPQDFDLTGLFDLKHMLANLLAHERRYLISPEHIACGAWPTLQTALIHGLAFEGYLLVDDSVSPSLEHNLKKQGIAVLRLPEIAQHQAALFIEQVEKYCINYPVAALWCNTSSIVRPQNIDAEQSLLVQKLSDYQLLLIDDQRSSLPYLQEQAPFSAKYAHSLLLGSLYGRYCDRFNLSFIASRSGFSNAFINELNEQQQQSALLNMLAQSELIKRGEYKKLLANIQRFVQHS